MHYRSIAVGLYSQFDIETLPEYRPDCHSISDSRPQYIEDKTSTCSVYVPALPGSTFWIGYSVSPPVPEGHYFLFKLFIDGAHITSWSTGKEEEWQGKTMFGLFEGPEDEDGKRRTEKRVLCFSAKDTVDVFDHTARIEIRVHRADARKRVERQTDEYNNTEHAKTGKGISLVSAGRAGPEQPKRFYKFALIDPIDQPFATFRYFYRTWDQLRGLGLLAQNPNGAGEENDLPVIEPQQSDLDKAGAGTKASSTISRESGGMFQDCQENSNGRAATQAQAKGPYSPMRPLTSRASLRRVGDTEQPRAYVPRGAPSLKMEASAEHVGGPIQQRDCFTSTPGHVYQLSISPSIELGPPESASRPLPTLPMKHDLEMSTSYCPHPAYPVDDWAVRTPSPVKSVRDGISTPPPGKHREQGRSTSALMSAITSAWRRRGTQTTEGTRATEGTEDARSLP